jgi:integrase
MQYPKIPHTIVRNGIYYLNFRLNDKKFIRQSLLTDSARQAKFLVGKMLPSIRKMKNQMELSSEEDLVDRISALNQVIRTMVSNIRERANAAMYPTSNEAMLYIKKWNSICDDIECPEDIEPDYWEGYLQAEYYNQPSKHALDYLFPLEVEPKNTAYNIVHAIFNPTKPEFHNVLESVTRVYDIASSIRENIEAFDYPEAEKQIKSLELYAERLCGDKLTPPAHITSQPILSVKETSPLLSDCFNQFIKSKITGRVRWTDKQQSANKRNAETLIALIGDMPIKDIDSRVLDDAFSIAIQMPKRNKKPYSSLSVPECIELAQAGDIDEGDIVSIKTVKELKKLLQGLCKFLKFKREIDKSPTEGMLISLSSNTRRGAFSYAQMQSIVEHGLTQSEDYKKWPLLIMSYTGMRNGEIMQLRQQDIKYDAASKVHYFHITPDAGAVKTKAAIRTIPIHSKLLEQEFLAFVRGSNDRLFEQGARALTSYYQRIKKLLQLPDVDENNDILSLYSIRHRVITTLQSKGVNPSTTQQLVGHSKQGSITDRYTHSIDLTSLQLAIEIIHY